MTDAPNETTEAKVEAKKLRPIENVSAAEKIPQDQRHMRSF